jgi:hypothetical protein
MQAVKAVYKEGNIHLLTPLVGVSEAELFVIVLDKDDQASEVAQSFHAVASNSELEFQAIGLSSFLIPKMIIMLTGRSYLMLRLGKKGKRCLTLHGLAVLNGQ